MGLLEDIGKANRYLFTRWSFISNRKLLLLWCNGVCIFYLLNLVFPTIGYGTFTLVLAVLFLAIEIGEILSQKKPKTESEVKPDKTRTITLGKRIITISRKQDDKSNQQTT